MPGAGEISLPNVQINPMADRAGQTPPPPSPESIFLQTYLEGQQMARQNRTADAQIEAQKAHTAFLQGSLKLEQEKQKTQQAALAAQQSETEQRGKAAQSFLKGLQPGIEQHVQSHPEVVSQLMGTPQGGGSPLAMGGPQQGPAQTPMVAPTPVSGQPQATPAAPAQPTWGNLVDQMSPQSALAFATEDLPKLVAVNKALEPKPMVPQNIGGSDTIYDPNKSLFYDAAKGPPSDPKAWVASIKRTMTDDQKEQLALNRRDTEARIAAMGAYKQSVQSQALTKMFMNSAPVKAEQTKGQVVMQALMNINDAMKAPNPADRRVLTGQAIASFVVAAEPRAPQLRYQMLKYFKDNIDTRFTGKVETMASLLATGQYRDDQYAGMVHHLQNVLTQARSEYERQRAGEIKRHPDLGAWIPPADEYFTSQVPDYSSQAAPPVDFTLPPPRP